MRANSPLGTFLDKQDNQDQNQDLTQHGSHLRFKDFVKDAKTKRRRHAARQLTNAAEHHHEEGVDNVATAQLGPDVTELRQRDAAQPRDPRTEAKRQHIDPSGRHAAAGRHRAVLRHSPHVHP